MTKGETDLGFYHATTDALTGAAGSSQVSVMTVDLASPSYNVLVKPQNIYPLTSNIKSKAWKLSSDRKLGPAQRVVQAELYGPKPTPAQRAAVQAARKEAATYDPPVVIKVRYRP